MYKFSLRRGRFLSHLGWAPGVLMLVCLAFGGALSATSSPASGGQELPAAPADPPAEQSYKNIQALKGMPASQLKPVMELISSSLGMRCDQCHVTGAYEKDDKRSKQTARRMIRMVLDVNRDSFEGETQVTCYSCHRGQERPVSVPPIGAESAPSAVPARRAANTDLPTFDQVVGRYLEAVGEPAAYEKLKTRVMKGTLTDAGNHELPVEIDQAAPDKVLTVITQPDGTVSRGYNGSVGWVRTAGGQSELRGTELAQIRREADMARPLKIREECLSPRVLGKTSIDDTEVYLVSGRADGQRVQLYFDVKSGLLVRRRVLTGTVVGVFPDQTDYEDYRDVDGVKLPFIVKRSTPGRESTLKFTEVVDNPTLDAAKFDPPQIQK